MLRIGLIGAGNLGKAHAESIAHIPDVKLTAIADIDDQAIQALKEQWANDAAIMDANQIADSSEIDAVIIATPTPLHYQQAHRALSMKKHVYLEMPMTRQLKEAQDLTVQASESNKVLTVGHSLRGYQEYAMIKQRVADGAVGKPGMIRLGRRTPHPRSWYSNIESSGGVILDAMIHEFDFINWCFGPVERVFCRNLQEGADYALASLKLKSGAIAHVESSWRHYGQFHLDVEVAGDKGLIQYDNQESIPMYVSLTDPEKGTRHFFTESPVIKPAHYKIMEGFLNAAQGKGDNPAPPEDALAALKIAHAALESVKTRQPVTLG